MSNNPTINELQNATVLSTSDYLVVEQDSTKKITLGDLVNEVSKVSGISNLEERINTANNKASELTSKVAEVFQSVSNDKKLIVSAVADMNLNITNDNSFQEIINKIHKNIIVSDEFIIENDTFYYLNNNTVKATGYNEINVSLNDNSVNVSINNVINCNHTIIISDGVTRKEFEIQNNNNELNANCEIPEEMTDKTLYITIKFENSIIGTILNKSL